MHRKVAGTEIRYYLPDYLNSPVALVEGSGASKGTILERYEYDAYGKRSIYDAAWNSLTSSGYSINVAFTGQRIEVLDGGNLEMMYYKNRWYDTEQGRFISQDPLGIEPGGDRNGFMPIQQYLDGINLLNLVGNNPINYTDLLGNARFGKRWIRDSDPVLREIGAFFGAFLGLLGLDLGNYHECLFYEDGTGDYAEFGSADSEDIKDYWGVDSLYYNDDLMREAQQNVDSSGDFDGEDYGTFSNNCISYCDALRDEYEKLGGTTINDPIGKEQREKLGVEGTEPYEPDDYDLGDDWWSGGVPTGPF